MKRVLVAAAALACAGGASAQQRIMYITKDNRGGTPYIVGVQNGSIVSQQDVSNYTGGQGPGGIAVFGDVRFESQFGAGGGRLDLNLNDIGPSYGGLPFTDSYDGTTDGKYNYITDYATGDVYRTDRDYTNTQWLFNNGDGGTIGITCDPAKGLIYTHSQDTANVYIHNTGGQYVGQFKLDFNGNWRGLAFDPGDGTLWLTQHDPVQDIIRQVNLSGNTLQTVNVPGLSNLVGGPLGAEFDLSGIPAPGASVLLGLGGLAAARRRRA